MKRGSTVSLFLAIVSILGLGGCKLERNDIASEGSSQQVVSGSQGGDMTALVEGIWDSQVVPHLRQTATDMKDLAVAIGTDLDSAGEASGYRPSSEGSPWNFAVQVNGVIVSAKTDTRAATADVDVNGDGAADVTLQLGPVIRGTALRDILPFVDFSSFTDQIEFAQLSRSLNTRAYETVLKDLPRDALAGQTVDAIGAFTERGKGPPYLVTPVSMKVGGQ
ncbi:putative lipoprotein [Labrenzia sp. EL_142]|nr:putative lipoprotein [Labrenzia sp. EL_142]